MGTGSGLANQSDRARARIYDSWFSPEGQLSLNQLEDYEDQYLAQLRLDAILFRTVVLTDIAVIDGWFFGQNTPEDLVEFCGRGTVLRRLPIEVRCRGGSFESALATFLVRPDREMLNDYPLQLLREPDAREAIRQGLANTPSTRLDSLFSKEPTVARAVGRLLSEILDSSGIKDHTVEQFVPIWERWVEAERSGIVSTTRWDAPIPLSTAFGADPLDRDIDLLTSAGREAHTDLLRLIGDGRANKSDLLNALYPDGLSEVVEDEYAWDCTTLIEWFDRARSRAIAFQHEASFGYDQAPVLPLSPLAHYRGLAAFDEDPPLEDRFVVELPKDFRGVLQAMDSAAFGRLFAIHGDAFRNLWSDPQPSNMRRAADLTYEYATTNTTVLQAQRPERLLRVFGQLLGAFATAQVTGPVGGLAMLVASEGALRFAESARKRQVTRSVVEYWSRRDHSLVM